METRVIRRVRAVPPTGRILVSMGDPVMPDTPVARVEILPGRLWRTDVARALSVDPARIDEFMLRRPGERVKEGEVLAVGGDFFDRRAAKAPSPGILALLSKHRGFAYVREDVEVGAGQDPVTVEVARALGVENRLVVDYKVPSVKVGVLVLKGQVLAARKGEGYRDRMVTSPVYGRVTDISPARGTVTVTPVFKSPDIPAYMKGTVVRVVPGEGVEIAGRATLIAGLWGLGGESWGFLRVLDGDLFPGAPLEKGSVVVASGTSTLEGLQCAREAGVKGLVLGYLPSETAVKFAGVTRNIGITGDEDVPFPLVLTEGFLPARMEDGVFRAFLDAAGLTVSLRGVTHIRAGVIRPEIIISRE